MKDNWKIIPMSHREAQEYIARWIERLERIEEEHKSMWDARIEKTPMTCVEAMELKWIENH